CLHRDVGTPGQKGQEKEGHERKSRGMLPFHVLLLSQSAVSANEPTEGEAILVRERFRGIVAKGRTAPLFAPWNLSHVTNIIPAHDRAKAAQWLRRSETGRGCFGKVGLSGSSLPPSGSRSCLPP